MGADAARGPRHRRGAAAVATVANRGHCAAIAVRRIGRHRFRIVEACDFRLLAASGRRRRCRCRGGGGLAVDGTVVVGLMLLVIVVVRVGGVSVLAVQRLMLTSGCSCGCSCLVGGRTRAAVQFGGGIAVGRWCGGILLRLCIVAVRALGHRVGIAVHAGVI